MRKLNNCPFCEEVENLQKLPAKNGFFVHCASCGASGPRSALSMKTAEEGWNDAKIGNDWISVKERLPTQAEMYQGMYVMVYRPGSYVKVTMETLHPLNWEAEGLATRTPITMWKVIKEPE